MFNTNDRVKVVTSTWDDIEVGSLGTVIDATARHVMVMIDGFVPTPFDIFMAHEVGCPEGSLPFIAEELEYA
jgi:hypothetical protein